MADRYKAYCMKCRAKREFEGTIVELGDGHKAARGTCPVCGLVLATCLDEDELLDFVLASDEDLTLAGVEADLSDDRPAAAGMEAHAIEAAERAYWDRHGRPLSQDDDPSPARRSTRRTILTASLVLGLVAGFGANAARETACNNNKADRYEAAYNAAAWEAQKYAAMNAPGLLPNAAAVGVDYANRQYPTLWYCFGSDR